MKKNSLPKWIDDYSKSVKDFTFGDHDPSSHLPFNAFYFYQIYFDLWLDKIYLSITKIRNEKNISKKLPAFGSLRYIFYTLVNMSAYHNYDMQKAKVVFDFFIRQMSQISKDEDLFNEVCCQTKSKEKIEADITNLKTSNKDDKQSIAKLSGVLAMYNHALYNDYSTEYGYNIDGPYKIKNQALLIKSYPDLNPEILWPELKKLNIKRIQIYSLYSNVNIKMRFVSTHIIATEQYQDRLVKHLVALNGEEVKSYKKIDELTEKLASLTAQIYLKTKNMSFEEQKIKFLEQQAYELKGLFDLAQVNWKPDKSILERVKDQKLVEGIINMSYPRNKKEYEEYVGVAYLREVYQK